MNSEQIGRALPGFTYGSGKSYEFNQGFSCAFRQWRAQSHCSLLHGYALKFQFEFEAQALDLNNWVMDFGGLKPLKAYLERQFDHTTLVAQDDPQISIFREMEVAKMCQLRIVPSVGCEAIARLVYDWTADWLESISPKYNVQRITLMRVTVHEHLANSASYGLATATHHDITNAISLR